MFVKSVLLALGTICLAAAVQAEEPPQNAPDDLLDLLRRQAQGNVYTICEIHNGVSRVVEIVPATRCHNTYSVAKLFAVTAVGILEDRGRLSTDELVYPIFADRFPEKFDPKWKRVKVIDVMSHRFGIENAFLDIDAENSTTWGNDDFLNIVLSTPLKFEPGEKTVYSDAAYYLVSRIVSEKCGERLDDFLIRELLVPLKFAEYAFSKCPKGYPIGATGMYISTEDMAKLGQLYLQKGVYDGKRILSERFVEKVFELGLELRPLGDSGYTFKKGGMNGQFLYVNRKTGRVVAVHSFQGNVDALLDTVMEYDRRIGGY